MRRAFVVVVAVVVAATVLMPAGVCAAEATPEGVSAQYVSLVLLENRLYDDGTGQWWWDGIVENPLGSGADIQFPTIRLEYHSLGDAPLGEMLTVVEHSWVLVPGAQMAFHHPIALPAGYGHAHTSAYGNTTTSLFVPMSADFGNSGLGDHGWRWAIVRITNTRSYPVVDAWPNVYETMDLGGGAEWWNIMAPAGAFQQRLAPGEWADVMVWGIRPRWGGDAAGRAAWATARPAPPTDPVYRFYNKRTGTHFYTIDPIERDGVIANLGWLYAYEGPAYHAYANYYVNERPLYRFYNKVTGTHFYTADESERNNVIAKLGWLYHYEGVGLFICDSGGAATNTMYRFYNKRTGTHFFTVDPAERDNVMAKLGWLYQYEGPVFNVPKAFAGSI